MAAPKANGTNLPSPDLGSSFLMPFMVTLPDETDHDAKTLFR